MANNVQYQQQQHGAQNSNPHHCKECGLYLNSAESLEVHLQYHKENLLNKWASQAAGGNSTSSSHGNSATEETNNNSTKSATSSSSSGANNTSGTNHVVIKREFPTNSSTIAAAADSSDSMVVKKSPEYGNRATPDTSASFGHPPTPQSYHSSASSPYQTPDNSAFSPNFQNYPPVKTERGSPAAHQSQQQQHMHFQQQQGNTTPYGNYAEHQQQQQQHFFPLENPNYSQEYPAHKISNQQSFRYHPYGNSQQHYERNNTSQVSSSSPAYPPQPTPSPSPKQCDKCGFVCESASQLIEHLNVAHPPQQAQSNANYAAPPIASIFFPPPDIHIKTEEETQSEILDLDSHKVHQVYQEEEKQQQQARTNGDSNGHHNPHSVTAMLNSWPGQQQQKIFSPEHRMFGNSTEFINGGNVSTTSSSDYNSRASFEQQSPASVISSTQPVAAGGAAIVPNAVATPPTKAANWKSNEARRPKTYNCTACNKWFTSSGHLKRHYNTTLHKNAVKSSGQPDPATMPISAHHHPARETSSSREELSSNSPTDDSRSEDCFDRAAMLQQQQVAAAAAVVGGYERQPPPPNIHPLHSPMGQQQQQQPPQQQVAPPPSQSQITSASSPNGEAGPSVTNQDSRGLLLINNHQHHSMTSIEQTQSPQQQQQHHQQLHQQQQHHHGFHQQIITTPPVSSLAATNTIPIPSNSITPTDTLHPHHHHHPVVHHLQHHPAAPHHITTTTNNTTVAAAQQFPMYPNEYAPHVMQATVISSLSTTGEEHHDQDQEYCAPPPHELQQHQLIAHQQQPLPSFAHFQANRVYTHDLLMSYSNHGGDVANVGGSVGPPATAPFTYYTIPSNEHLAGEQPPQFLDDDHHHQQRDYEANDYKLTILTAAEPMVMLEDTSNYLLQAAAATTTSIKAEQLDEDYKADYILGITNHEPPVELRPASPEKAKTERQDYNNLPLKQIQQVPQKRKHDGTTQPPKAKRKCESTVIKPKRDYEESSPQITSTTVLKAVADANRKGATIHKCFDCDKVFNKSCYLTQHNKTFHCGDKPFKCTRCGKRFSCEQSYEDHLAKHAGEKPHKCDLCPKQFNHKTDLRRHMCLHTGQKPYACDTCGKGFIRKDHMIKHCETHTRKTSQRITTVR